MNSPLFKPNFPDSSKKYYLLWRDYPNVLGAETSDSLEVILTIAYIRVLFSGFQGHAMIIDVKVPFEKNAHWMSSDGVCECLWMDRKVVFRPKQGGKWNECYDDINSVLSRLGQTQVPVENTGGSNSLGNVTAEAI